MLGDVAGEPGGDFRFQGAFGDVPENPENDLTGVGLASPDLEKDFDVIAAARIDGHTYDLQLRRCPTGRSPGDPRNLRRSQDLHAFLIVLEFADRGHVCNVEVNGDKGISDVQSIPFGVRRDMGRQSADFEYRRAARLEGLGPLDAVRNR